MRVNVYGEELTNRIELVTRTVEDPEHETKTFYGIRFWLKFPNQDWWVHRKYKGEVDDDSTALTIWSGSRQELTGILQAAIDTIRRGDVVED